ncbi:hypothetical protein Tco_0762502, partial [Tanacetum coccineum]
DYLFDFEEYDGGNILLGDGRECRVRGTGESLSEAWTRFKDLLQKVSHHGIDLWLQVQIFYNHVNPVTRRTIDQSSGGKLRDRNIKESWALLKDLALYDNESWNDPTDFAKPVKAISLPQDVLSTSDRHHIELENQVQRLMEAHLAPMLPNQVNKITTSCEICSGPYDTSYCMEDPEQAFVKYATSRTDEAGEGLVSNFMASQDARLSKFEADFKQQQSEMTNKIDTVLKAITDQIAGALPSDTVKNPKLSTSSVLSACSYPTKEPQCSAHIHGSINAITIHPNNKVTPMMTSQQRVGKERRIARKIPIPTLPHHLIHPFRDDGDVMFIEIVKKNDDSRKEEPKAGGLEIMGRKLDPKENSDGGISNFTGRIKGMHVFIGNFRLYLRRRSLEVLRKFSSDDSWRTI